MVILTPIYYSINGDWLESIIGQIARCDHFSIGKIVEWVKYIWLKLQLWCDQTGPSEKNLCIN